MGDSFVTIISIVVAAVLLLVFPLMSMADRADDTTSLLVQTATTEFVDNIRSTGKLTQEDYDAFKQTITSTGNSFEIDFEIQLMSDNPGVKTSQADMTKIGENLYYNIYTSQVEEALDSNGRMSLTKGDRISVSVRNTNSTMGQILNGFFYSLTRNGDSRITAQHAGIVTARGK